jgi:hypothetical protein
METSMKYALPAAIAVVAVTLTACERPASTSSTTVIQPTTEKETVVQRDVPVAPSTTIVNPPSPPASVTIDASRPDTTERTRTKSSERVETPLGTVSRETTETSKTTR